MGTWGHNAFENDDALDFIVELSRGSDTKAMFDEIFRSVLDVKVADASQSATAIAASEVIAKANGHHAKGVPDEVRQWLDAHAFHPKKLLVRNAVNVCHKILHSSELKDLWENLPAWKRSVLRTIDRLERAPRQVSGKALPKRRTTRGDTTSTSNAISRLKRNCIYVHFEKRKPVSASIDLNKLNAELIADLRATPSITHLDFSGTVIFGTNPFDSLAQVTQLKTVWVSDCHGFRDDHLAFCNVLPNLMSLSVRDRKITDLGMAHLKSCKALKTLNIDGTAVTDTGLEIACQGKKIESLSATRTRITGAAFKCFSPGSLGYVILSSSQLSNYGLKHLCRVGRSVKTLSLDHCQGVSDGGLSYLSNLKRIDHLWLGGRKITGTGFGFLRYMNDLKFLVVFESNPDFCKNVVRHLNKSSIESVQLNGPFGSEDLLLLSTVKQLKFIEFVGSTVPKLYAHQLANDCGIQIEASC